jgi:YihY family inner membrane protein
MNLLQKGMRRVDGFQQRHTAIAFVVGVLKKYGDDNASNLAVQLAYTLFLTVFPLLLLVVTITSIVLVGDPSAQARVANSAFGQFPIIGTQLAHQIHALRRSSVVGLVVGIVGLLYGATGLAQTGLYAMAQVWNIPSSQRPSFLTRLGRSVTFLVLLAVGLIVTTVLSGFGTFGHHNVVVGYLAEVLAAVLNSALYLAAFCILTPKQIRPRALWRGAVVGGVAWTVLQAVGGYVVGHDLKGASDTYGTFGLVLGLLAWIYLGAEVTLYAAEVNTVIARRLWPRALVQPPLTAADQESLALQVLETQRRPEQEVSTTIHSAPMTEDEFRSHNYEIDPSSDGLSRRSEDKTNAVDVASTSEPRSGIQTNDQ